MAQIFAYLRVSTDAQDVANQKTGVVSYCIEHRHELPAFVEDTASGRKSWRDRPLGALIARCQSGDVLVVAEVSRLARSTLQVLEIMQECATRDIRLHVVKNRIVLDGTLQAKVIATVFGLAAEIERDFIAARTREALQKMKAEGVQLGRPPGPAKRLALDDQAEKIDQYLALKLDKRAIAKLVGCAPNTLYKWLRLRRALKT
jgi:DNA invertase Pin-like site-specific DNA recombinase